MKARNFRPARRAVIVGGVLAVLVAGGTLTGVALATENAQSRGTTAVADASEASTPTNNRSRPAAQDEQQASSAQQLSAPSSTAPRPAPSTANPSQPKPEKLSPVYSPKPTTTPPKPKADCSPVPYPSKPKASTSKSQVGQNLWYNGSATISICATPTVSKLPPKVLTYNQSVKIIEQLRAMKPATNPNELCTMDMKGFFQIYIDFSPTKRMPMIYNGEAHGCGYVTYTQFGQTYYGGKELARLVSAYLSS